MTEQKEFFTGSIIQQQRKKVYHKNSEWYGQIFYKLTIGNYSQSHIIFAYANLISKALWSVIESKNYQSQYLFTVQKSKWGWILLDFQAKN